MSADPRAEFWRPDLRSEALAAAGYLLLPGWMLMNAAGTFLAPAQDGAGLYGELFAAAILRRWAALEVTPGMADTSGAELPWWPEAPLPALLQAALTLLQIDASRAFGLVLLAGFWLAGYGPWRLCRRHLPDLPLLPLWLAGLAVQSAPVVLRAVPDSYLASLGVGALALSLAHPRLAWIGGLWSWPSSVALLLAGLVPGLDRRRRLPWLLAGLPAFAVLLPPSALPGALRSLPAPVPTVPAYIAGGAVFPLPPPEAAPLIALSGRTGLWVATGTNPADMAPGAQPGAQPPGAQPGTQPPGPPRLPGGAPAEKPKSKDDTGMEATRPWIGALLVPMQRLYAGPLWLLGLLAALTDRRARPFAAASLGLLLALLLIYGWQPFPDEEAVAPHVVATLRLLLDGDQIRLLPGRDHGVGALAWASLLGTGAALGLAVLWSGRGRYTLPLLLLGPLMENPRLVAPVTPVLPDPMVGMMRGLPPGEVLVFPAPQPPYFQGPRSHARLLYELASSGHFLPEDRPAQAAFVAQLVGICGLPVDTRAGAAIWGGREVERPVREALAEGYDWLLLDLQAIPEHLRPQVDGWLAAQVGMPLAREGGRLLYDLEAGPGGMASPLGR